MISSYAAVVRYYTWKRNDGVELYQMQLVTVAGRRGYVVTGTTTTASTRLADEANLLVSILLTFRPKYPQACPCVYDGLPTTSQSPRHPNLPDPSGRTVPPVYASPHWSRPRSPWWWGCSRYSPCSPCAGPSSSPPPSRVRRSPRRRLCRPSGLTLAATCGRSI